MAEFGCHAYLADKELVIVGGGYNSDTLTGE